MIENKFATLTLGEQVQDFDEDLKSIGGHRFFALITTVQETRAKRGAIMMKNIDMLVKVGESLGGGCANNSPDAQLAWERALIAIDSGACDSVMSPEHVPDHEIHESVGTRCGELFQSAIGEPILNLGDLRLPLYVREGTVGCLVMEATLVTKPFAKKICQAGHSEVFARARTLER